MTQILGYNSLLRVLSDSTLNWLTDDHVCVLLTNGYTFDPTHAVLDDVLGTEVAGVGYTTGGTPVLGKTLEFTDPWETLRCDDPAWPLSVITAQFAVFAKDTGSTATSPLMLTIDAETDISSAGTTFLVPIDIDGLARLAFS